MKITITSRPELTTVDGVQCRAWDGITDQGVPCVVFVQRVVVPSTADQAAFLRELTETEEPAEVRQLPLRQVL